MGFVVKKKPVFSPSVFAALTYPYDSTTVIELKSFRYVTADGSIIDPGEHAATFDFFLLGKFPMHSK